MMSLVVYGVIAISLASIAGYCFLTFTNTGKQATFVQENQGRLGQVVSALQSAVITAPPTYGGYAFLPMGVTVADGNHVTYTQLPASLGALSMSPWGQPYLYCPVSQTQSTSLPPGLGGTFNSSVVESPSGATYQVNTYTGPSSANLPYVISNSTFTTLPNTWEYLGFVVSSAGPGKTIPDCSRIVVTGNSVTVPGGVVRAVTAGFPFKQQVTTSNDRMEFYASTSTTGDGTGRDANNLTTVDYALNLWVELQPRQTNIYLAGNIVYSLSEDLNAEHPVGSPTPVATYPLAQGQNAALAIGTIPGSAAPATISLSSAVTLTSPVSFINVNVEAASTLTAVQPLLFKNVSYTSAEPGTVFSVTGTSFMAQNTNFTNTVLQATNATVEFYDWTSIGTASTFVDSQISGSLAQFSFDGQSASTYTFSGNGTNNFPISVVASTLNIGTNATVNISNTTDSIVISNTAMTVAGTLAMSGGATLAPLDVFDGSVLDVPLNGKVSATQSSGAMPYGLFIRGSKVALDGTLTTTGLNTGAIGISEGEFTGAGTGTIIDAQSGVYPCLFLTNGANGTPVPVFITNPTATGNPVFTTVQKGYQPMVGDTTNSIETTLQSSSAGYLSATSPVNDPQVYNSVGLSTINAVSPQPIGYVDPLTFERGVRDLVNLESLTGVNLNFYGTCQP